MAEIILHHYDTSPFSEKVRVMLGIKGLAWRSVVQPVIMPKPELIPLTGGYRRIPVMQIGADVYCDSQVIVAELDARHPEPATVRGADWAVNLWADRLWFQATVAVVFGEIGEAVPRAFIQDREQLSGRPFDVAAMKAAAPFARAQWRAYAAWLEKGLSGGDYLGGASPSLGDVAAYMNVWWLWGAAPTIAERLLQGLDRVKDWRARMAAIGHGRRSEMTGGEALQVAMRAQPAAPPDSDPADVSDLKLGDAVVVRADDYGRDPVEGRLVALTRDRAVVARECGELDVLHVHFPRAGYVLARA
ncbi:glutathione S-transferase family protein [Phenylobacterium sp.]|uniref:glutathione S-transferase family protein n=1 Tax=Phenylobacterium sp. TaxID=1871053 RepID=UPI0028112563|nr:glutathione S-transferase family protein [Phenylobacterium sp.]